jgi:hypothetical protein
MDGVLQVRLKVQQNEKTVDPTFYVTRISCGLFTDCCG